MSLQGRKHRLVVSSTNQDTTAAETVDIQFRPQSGHNLGPNVTEYYRGSDETGGESHLEEIAPVPIAVDYAKSSSFGADDVSCLFFPFFATQGGSATSPSQLDTSSGVYEHIWNGPNTNGTALSFSMEDQGDPAASDGDLNHDVHNITPSSVTIAGQRRGVVTVSADMQGGQSVANASAQVAGTFHRTKLLTFSMSHCFTEAADLGIGALSTFRLNSMTTDAEVKANSHLGGTPLSLTTALQEFSIEMTQGLDLQRSMAPGNTTAAFAGYVPTNTDWVYTGEQQQVEIELVFTSNHTAASSLVETLLSEYEAGTRRSWEIWLVHPQSQAGGASFAHFGIKASIYQATPVSWVEENDSFGERYVRVRYRAGWNTTDNMGWHFAVGSTFTTAIGG